MNKQGIAEKKASKIFIRSLEKDDSDELFYKVEENHHIDIIYKPDSLKFQVVSIEGGPVRIIRDHEFKYGATTDELIQKYIIDPIDKKTDQYGPNERSELILLIHALNKPFNRNNLFNKEIDKNKELILPLAKRSGFKSIYFISDIPEEVILIYS